LVRHVVTIGEGTSAFKILTSKPRGRRPIGKLRRRCKGSFRILFKYTSIQNYYDLKSTAASINKNYTLITYLLSNDLLILICNFHPDCLKLNMKISVHKNERYDLKEKNLNLGN
jgi:hypothetical protein